MSGNSNRVNDILYTGAIASAATTLAAAYCGAVEKGNPIAPLNAVSRVSCGRK